MTVRSHIFQTTCQNLTKFSVHISIPGALIRSSSDDNAVCNVLPVLWLTSCLPIVGEANATLIGHIFKVIHEGAARGA